MKPILLVAVLLLARSVPAAGLYKCPRPPLIDGVADPVWEEAGRFPLFTVNSGRPLVMETVARLMHDNQNLYAFVHCREVNLVEARDQEKFNRHDAPVWGNGCVEFFFDVRNDGRAYYQFVVDIHGSAADLLHHDPDGPQAAIDWDGVWHHAIGTDADGWTVEVAIPWRTLNVTPGDRRLGLNISRVRRISPFERGTLAAGTSSISDLARFPVFAPLRIEASDVTAEIQPGAVFLGKNRMRLRVRNHAETPISGRLELVGTAAADASEIMRQAVPLELQAGETRDMTIEYRVDTPGRVQMAARLVRDPSALLLDLADYVFRQPVELNERHPLVLAGEDHPVYVRIFTDEPEWSVDATVIDRRGNAAAARQDAMQTPNAFLLLPTARLAPGEYTVKIALRHDGVVSETEAPLTVIRRL